MLDQQNNQFHGTISKTFAKGNKLRSFNLNGNQLEETLPRSLVNCKHLEVLDLINNKINDIFPHWLGTLPNLCVLVLQAISFHDTIGYLMTKFTFTNLQNINVSHHKFSDCLPKKYFNHLKPMMNSSAKKGVSMYIGDNYYHDLLI